MAQVTLKAITKSYNGIDAVKSVTIDIADGEFMAILGPPGAGKTSTLKMIAGVEEISSGEVLFDGIVVNEIPPNKRDVAMVFESYALYPHMTAFENIAYPLKENRRKYGYNNKQIEEKVMEIARLLQFSEHLERKPAHLSGGQRQRVALGRALVREPRVIMFDEPIAHLDARLRHQLRGELKRIQRSRKTTTIYATPDYLEAIAMADRVAVLFNGVLHQIGSPVEILRTPATSEVAQFVGDPPMNILPSRVVDKNGNLYFISSNLEFKVPSWLKNSLENEIYDQDILVGIKPKDINIFLNDHNPQTFKTKLYVMEALHRKSILSLERNGLIIKVNTNIEFQVKVGSPVWIEFPEDKLFVFDPNTNKALSPMDR
jgi:multiple sugar transport system ATP-binding protein